MALPPLRLRTRVVLLIAAAAVPGLILFTLNEMLNRRAQAAALHTEALLLSASAANAFSRLLENVHQVLDALGNSSAVRGLEVRSCNRLLAGLAERHDMYAAFAVLDPAGRPICLSRSPVESGSEADRAYFREAFESGQFAVGDYDIGFITGEPVINLARPVFADDGRIIGIITAAISTSWFQAFAAAQQLPPYAALTVTDRDGVILARTPERQFAGQHVHATRLDFMLSATPDVVEHVGFDGAARVTGHAPLHNGKGMLHVAVSLGRDRALASKGADPQRALLLLAAGVLSMLLIGWIGADRLIQERIARFDRAARAWRDGNFRERVRLDQAPELREIGRSLNEMADSVDRRLGEFEQLRRERTSLVRTVGHDLRGPALSLLSFINVLERLGTRALQPDILRHARAAIRQQIASLDTLLSAARLEDGYLATRTDAFPLRDLLEQIGDGWRIVAEEKGLELRVGRCNLLVRSDRELLRIILDNLVSNAIKYTQSGGLLLACRRRHGNVIVGVYDTGSGIPPERLADAFRPYVRIQEDGTSGHGLGLSIVNGLAARLGHRLHVRSVPGRGSFFGVEVLLVPQA